MLPYVLAGDVGEVFLIAAALSLEHQAVLVSVRSCSEATGAQEQP
jgi:hypothetical protein